MPLDPIEERFLIRPDWPAPPAVRALVTTRNGGVSAGAYAGSENGGLNLGSRCGDDPAAVVTNRARLRALCPNEPVWLYQVHGTRLLHAATATRSDAEDELDAGGPEADASWTQQANVVCAIQMADCMPVLFCDQAGTMVAAAHVGWRGLAGGVIETTVQTMQAQGVSANEILVWLGPVIGPTAFEVGDDVLQAFIEHDRQHGPAAHACFQPHGRQWLCDLEALARQRLRVLGITQVFGGGRCTVREPETFYSFRRDRITGRMAALIWLEGQPDFVESADSAARASSC